MKAARLVFCLVVVMGMLFLLLRYISPVNGTEGALREEAIQAGQRLYRNLKTSGADLSAGPCISQQILPDWCVDLVHSPRIPSDDLPANRCPTYLDGRVRHQVELDLEGRLIRAE